ncbi:MAG: hypothetical protein A2V66_06145 [Ignavibacteria bacterium RBG_13_36_8]|nr:MAG: hypothetical protein A2V66_06145 [Ignavibacteria bacterium RBG_13_36_8]
MRYSRRIFLRTSAVAGAGLIANKLITSKILAQTEPPKEFPLVVSTWDFGIKTNQKALDMLLNGSSSLDSIEQGIRIIEDDPTINSVGYGGLPDEDGIVTLDALIMDWEGNAGAVAFLQNIKNPISVAKLVMQTTNHVMIVGEGAKKFFLANGFKEKNLLTEEARKQWLEWKRNHDPNDNWHDINKHHDTIGMLAIDRYGNMSGGVSTSGLGGKIHGRVGDSPIIRAALYIDNEVGGACATGNGEWVIKTVGSFLIVEKMREGFSPQESCEIAVKRVKKINKKNENIQVGYLALNKLGEIGAYSLKEGFSFCIADKLLNKEIKSNFLDK